MLTAQKIISAAIIGASLSSISYADTPPALKVKPKNHIELLFFQQASDGFIKPTHSGCYNLTLSKENQRVMYFANSPSKAVGSLTLDQFVETMIHSEQVEKIKPNAVLNMQLNNTTVNLIGNLSHAEYKNKQFHYTFCAFGNKQRLKEGEMRSINLFVDPIHRWPP